MNATAVLPGGPRRRLLSGARSVSRLPLPPLATLRLGTTGRCRRIAGCLGLALLTLGTGQALALTPAQLDKILLHNDYPGFGWRTAIEGSTLLVGSTREPDTGAVLGAAYVYEKRGLLWVRQARLVAADTSAGNLFGYAVALQGPLAIVAARTMGISRAYVFQRRASGWTQQGMITIGSTLAPLALDGATLAFGDKVFVRGADGSWTGQASLLTSDGPSEPDALSIDGDTIVMTRSRRGDHDPGGAYVFTRAGGAWRQQAKLPIPTPPFPSVAAVDLEGHTVLIGDSGNAEQPGLVRVFVRSGGRWTRQATLTASDAAVKLGPDQNENFGAAVGLSGDRALIGSPRDTARGAAYLFGRHNGVWTERAKLVAADGTDAGRPGFAEALAVDGELAVIGATNANRGRGAAYVFSLEPRARLFCPRDLDGDRSADLVVVTPAHQVIARALDGRLLNRFALTGFTEIVDVRLFDDSDSNGAAELVAYGKVPAVPGHTTTPLRAQVRDLLSSALLASIDFGAGEAPYQLAVMPDRTGDGISELAGLRRNSVRIEDGLGHGSLGTVTYPGTTESRSLNVYPDQNGNGVAELSLLRDQENPALADRIEDRDPLAGHRTRQIWLDRGWTLLQQTRLPGSGALAVLRVNEAAAVEVQLRDPVSTRVLLTLGFDAAYPPVRMLRVADVDRSGSDEVAVFGRRSDGSAQKVTLKDSRTGRLTAEIFFDRNFPGEDVVTCRDLNGNGSQEIAVLGRGSGGALKVMLKDSRTGASLGNVRF